MAKPVFSVMTTIPTHSGFVWWSIEFDEGVEIADVYEALKRDGIVKCIRIISVPQGSKGIRLVKGREPFLIGKGLVGTISPSHVELVEV